jgi:hypothetical protein
MSSFVCLPVRPSVRLSTLNSLAPIGRICMKYAIWVWVIKNMTCTLEECLFMFMIIPPWILFRIRNILATRWRENGNTFYFQFFFSSENRNIYEREKIWQSHRLQYNAARKNATFMPDNSGNNRHTHTHIHTHTLTHTHTHTYTHSHTRTDTHTDTLTHTFSLTHTHSHTHILSHTHTLTHTHTLITFNTAFERQQILREQQSKKTARPLKIELKSSSETSTITTLCYVTLQKS